MNPCNVYWTLADSHSDPWLWSSPSSFPNVPLKLQVLFFCHGLDILIHKDFSIASFENQSDATAISFAFHLAICCEYRSKTDDTWFWTCKSDERNCCYNSMTKIVKSVAINWSEPIVVCCKSDSDWKHCASIPLVPQCSDRFMWPVAHTKTGLVPEFGSWTTLVATRPRPWCVRDTCMSQRWLQAGRDRNTRIKKLFTCIQMRVNTCDDIFRIFFTGRCLVGALPLLVLLESRVGPWCRKILELHLKLVFHWPPTFYKGNRVTFHVWHRLSPNGPRWHNFPVVH